ncbi:MAG: hypothetical protein RI935_744 [Candidatus Parcubacteria bacterium]|jgi:hypothetical protein
MRSYFIGGIFSLILLFALFGEGEHSFSVSQDARDQILTTENSVDGETKEQGKEPKENNEENVTTLVAQNIATSTEKGVTHIKAPDTVRALYMSSWVASTPSVRARLVALIDETELNAIVIDVKDNTGTVTWDGRMKKEDLKSFIKELHAKDIYVIGRVAVFQDDAYAKKHKEESYQRQDGSLWKSKKGEYWVDAGSKNMWDYVLSLSKEAYGMGFDEINLDYIRFSTEGYNEKLVYPISGTRGQNNRVEVVGEFYRYITDALRKEGIPVSGDLFGIITTSKTDIPVLGQDIAQALLYFDYIAPMVYPSHYAKGTFGYQNPAAHPGPVIKEAMSGALRIADGVASSTGQATSTLYKKFRPWYQDFDMGATYTADMVRAQITAGENLGINSWMLWDPSNKYTREALKSE